jgi:hypothetical protein
MTDESIAARVVGTSESDVDIQNHRPPLLGTVLAVSRGTANRSAK